MLRPIPGFPDYVVDENGVVVSYKQRKPRVLARKVDDKGYPRVCLSREGTARWLLLHRLVLAAFVGPCPDGHEGRHLDGDPLNPHLDNLAWSTHRTNLHDKRRHGTDHNASRDRCCNGHPFTPANTYLRTDRGHLTRQCRRCNADAQRRRKEREAMRAANVRVEP